MNRRDALRALAGAAIAPGFLRWEPEHFIAALRPHLGAPTPAGDYQFQLLDGHQRAMVDEISDMIIPATDTPGASDVHVDEFIDLILAEWSSDKERADFLNGLAELDTTTQRTHHMSFLNALPAQREQQLRILDDELTAARALGKAWRPAMGPKPPDHTKLFWHQIRSLTVTGYYTSEPGYTLEARNVLIPGAWKSCTAVDAP
jgi:hypothetical protein